MADKNIPLPQSRAAKLRALKRGESLFFEGSVSGAQAQASKIATEKGQKRFVTKRENGGIRIWRA